MDDYNDNEGNSFLDVQEKLSEYWDNRIKNIGATIKVERQWAQFIKIKHDALIEAGFTNNEALEIVKAAMTRTS